MKKLLALFAVLLIPNMIMAFNPLVVVDDSEQDVNTDTTGTLHTITKPGFLHIFAHDKIYFTLDRDGVTPNTSSKFLAAGGSVTTSTYYWPGDKIGLLGDSGTPSANLTSYDELERTR